MAHFGNGKPMAVTHLSLSSRHDAKQAGGIKGSRSTGMIHGLATFNKYAASLKQSGEWAKEAAGLRYLKDLTPALAQQYLADCTAQGVGQKQLDTDRNALEFVTGKDSLERELVLAKVEFHSRAYMAKQTRLVVTHQGEKKRLGHRCGLACRSARPLVAHLAARRRGPCLDPPTLERGTIFGQGRGALHCHRERWPAP